MTESCLLTLTIEKTRKMKTMTARTSGQAYATPASMRTMIMCAVYLY